MSEFTVEGHRYKTTRLDAMVQLHVARKIVPMVSGSANIVDMMQRDNKSLSDIFKAVHPILDMVSKMDAADFEYVVNACASAVERQIDPVKGGWAPVWNGMAKSVMFQDMGPATLLRITAEVVKEKIAPFLPELLPILFGEAAEVPQQSATSK